MTVLRNRKDFDCNHCPWGGHCDDSNPAPFNKFVIAHEREPIEQNVCFLPQVTEQSMTLVRLHRHYSNGILMGPGGLLEQPNFYLQAMERIDEL